MGFWFGSSTPHRAMSANFWARLNGDGASLRRFSGAAWSVVGRRRPILDWRTLMVDLRHVVRSGTATDRYFGCNPSAGERRKWPRRGGNTRRALKAARDHTLRLAMHRLSEETRPTYRGRWCAVLVCAGAGGRWGSGTVARGSFETHASAWLQEANNDDSEDQTGASTEITAMIAVQAGRSRYTMHCYCAAPSLLVTRAGGLLQLSVPCGCLCLRCIGHHGYDTE